MIHLSVPNKNISGKVRIPGSKSETNRLLMLQAAFPNLQILNISDSDDTQALIQALNSGDSTIDIGHAGTAMRFLTAYFAFKEGEHLLTGSERMQQRPIKILVNALRKLGADIEYVNKEDYPPLLIRGRKPSHNFVKIQGDVSSQYISALLLTFAGRTEGLELELTGKVLSRPYIDMTVDLLRLVNIKVDFEGNKIKIFPSESIPDKILEVESDWSAASYFYSLAALSESADIELSFFKENSLQGDSVVAEFYKKFGVETLYTGNKIHLSKKNNFLPPQHFEADLIHHPDLAQTIAVTSAGLGISCKLTGLSNLKIKETNRLQALQNELTKFGVKIHIDDNGIRVFPAGKLAENVPVNTYDDHRMAMAFAPMVLKTPLYIQNPEVVSKSFPKFWEALSACKITLNRRQT